MLRDRDVLDQHRINPHTDHDQKSLEPQGDQGAQVVLPDLALLPVRKCRKRDWREACHQIDLDHPPVDDDEDHNGEGVHGDLDDERGQVQSDQRCQLHIFYRRLHRIQHRTAHCRSPRDQSAAGIDNVLCHVKDCHRDIEAVGDQHHGNEGLEDPLEKNPCLEIGQVVVVDDHLDQLPAADEGEDDAGDRHDDRLRKRPDHREHIRGKLCRCRPYFSGDAADTGIDRIEQAGQVVHDAVNEQFPQPRLKVVKY